MNATYTILTPYRRQRRFLSKARSGSSRLLAAALTLALGLPLAFGVSSYLSSRDDDADQLYVADGDMALPDLPPSQQQAEAQPAAAPLAGAPAQVALAPLPDEDPSRRVIRLEWGDTLIGLLLEAAVPEAEAHEAMAALKTVYDPRNVQAGEEVTLRYNEAGSFTGFEFEPAADRAVRVERKGDSFKAANVVRPLSANVMGASIEIQGSLYESGIKAGIPATAMASLVKTLSYSVDFQRDIKAGDTFRVMYEVMRNPEGQMVRTGDILYAEVVMQGRHVPIYRYRFNDGRTEYFDAKGQSMRKALLRTPVNAARISSGFGMRDHPIFGYSRMHKGVDFAAPTGTPIYASGDGVIIERGWKNGFGNYIRIRHNNTMATAYGHMSRFNQQFSKGSRVRQGDVIGYVGSTGNSTGSHLHYEVLIDGAQVNPLKVANLNVGNGLSGSDLNRLKGIQQAIDREFSSMSPGRAIDVAFNARTGEATRALRN